ncbi:hypothetical protein BOTNAR_0589g00070 [Botryotinia narcissicola]|uniref:Uncharacterized protein n=1 Tax=Botryotinia narcissicola TaxID=278944 RepID=A0A4Z1HC36_9HELO|nr:hypothetical protein BOTNAR_0589g00070 [Botryotinia narcissicola]
MSLTRGAGGFSIAPLLNFSATAPTSSPAFRLLFATKYMHPSRHPFRRALDGKSWVYSECDALRMYPEFDSSGRSHWGLSSHVIKCDEPDKAMEQLEEPVNHTLNDLRTLFQDGKASPNILNESGATLSENEGLAKCQHAIRIFRKFIEHANSIGLSTSNILEFLTETHLSLPEDVDEGDFTRLQERICDLGAIIKHTPEYTWRTELLRLSTTSVIDLPTILEAIFLQSEKGLDYILSQDPSAVNEVLYESGETPLHLAHQWPQGSKILIRAGGNVNRLNDCGELPLTLAANRNCYSPMKILLGNGIMLRTYSPQYSKSLSGDDASDFLRCIRNQRDSWRSTIFDHLIQRRHGLLELARSLMTASPTRMSGWLKTDTVLDAQAADVIKELKRHRVYIDPVLLPAFHPKTTTVYHMKNRTPELAEALYQSGFLDIDSRDNEGHLPILAQTKFETYETFDLPRWLITKGVDLTGTLD